MDRRPFNKSKIYLGLLGPRPAGSLPSFRQRSDKQDDWIIWTHTDARKESLKSSAIKRADEGGGRCRHWPACYRRQKGPSIFSVHSASSFYFNWNLRRFNLFSTPSAPPHVAWWRCHRFMSVLQLFPFAAVLFFSILFFVIDTCSKWWPLKINHPATSLNFILFDVKCCWIFDQLSSHFKDEFFNL